MHRAGYIVATMKLWSYKAQNSDPYFENEEKRGSNNKNIGYHLKSHRPKFTHTYMRRKRDSVREKQKERGVLP